MDDYDEKVDKLFPPAVTADTVATDIPSRSPRFKVHSKPGLAHNAMGQRGFGSAFAKYEFDNGVWVRTYAYIVPSHCKNCGEPFSRAWGSTTFLTDPREEDLPRWKRTPVCKDCVPRIKAEIEQEETDKKRREAHERYFLNN